MLSKRSGQKESDADIVDKVYKENFEDNPGEVFRSLSLGNGDIHNMRIHAGIVIDARSSQRRGEGLYNSSRLNYILIQFTYTNNLKFFDIMPGENSTYPEYAEILDIVSSS